VRRGVMPQHGSVSQGEMASRTLWASLLLLGLTCPAPADASTLVLPDGTVGPQPYQGWVDASLVPTPPVDVTLRLDGCPGEPQVDACSPVDGSLIALSPEWNDRRVLLHELGHVFDDLMPAWARVRFQRLVHRRGAWAPARSQSPPDEQFAEAYSLCATRSFLRMRHYAAYGYAPTPALNQRVCALIRRVGRSLG
jgi:hypothetical protein